MNNVNYFTERFRILLQRIYVPELALWLQVSCSINYYIILACEYDTPTANHRPSLRSPSGSFKSHHSLRASAYLLLLIPTIDSTLCLKFFHQSILSQFTGPRWPAEKSSLHQTPSSYTLYTKHCFAFAVNAETSFQTKVIVLKIVFDVTIQITLSV